MPAALVQQQRFALNIILLRRGLVQIQAPLFFYADDMKKKCPYCKAKPLKQFASGRFTKTCLGKPCVRAHWKAWRDKGRDIKKVKCQYCGKIIQLFSDIKREFKTCANKVCLRKNARQAVKNWKKANPDLLAEQKRRWRERRREAKETG